MSLNEKVISGVILLFSAHASATEIETIPHGSYRVLQTATYDGHQQSLQSGDSHRDLSTLSDAAAMRTRSLNEAVNMVGMGTLYARTATAQPAGEEILAVYHSQRENQNTGFLLQIPTTFDPQQACIVAVPETGSGKLYSAYDQRVHGAWGLDHHCAVVYTDKGQGNGVENLASGEVLKLDGTTTKDKHDPGVSFAVDTASADLQDYNRRFPNRFAFKHANSATNSDAHWGEDVVSAISFAFKELNKRPDAHKTPLTKENTTVLVYGSSNGGGASLKAGEFDSEGLIDGIVAVEPQIQPRGDTRISVVTHTRTYGGEAKSLVDYFTWAITWQPCASLAIKDAPLKEKVSYAANSCQSLKEKGMLQGATLAEQSQEALKKLHDYGWMSNRASDIQQPMHFLIAPTATAQKYLNAQGRFTLAEHLCGYSAAKTDAAGRPVAATTADLGNIWVKGYGGVPVADINLINDRNPGGPLKDDLSLSPGSGRQDYNLDGVLCLREAAASSRVQQGYQAVQASGDLRGIPTIIVHGHDDVRVPVNFSSRPYLALNSLVEGDRSRLSYIEVMNAGHFGAEKPFDDVLVPLDFYGEQAMDMMWAHLRSQQPLPASQVVRTTSRGSDRGTVNPLTRDHIPDIKRQPDSAQAIRVEKGQVRINEEE